MAQTSALSSGLGWGVILGLTGSSLLLGVLSLQNARRTCEFPDTEQCLFEQATWAEVAKLQAAGSVGLVLVAAGLFLMARRSRK